MEKLVLENEYKIVVSLFGEAFAAQIKVQQLYTNLDLYQQCQVLQKIEKFKVFPRPLSDSPVFSRHI